MSNTGPLGRGRGALLLELSKKEEETRRPHQPATVLSENQTFSLGRGLPVPLGRGISTSSDIGASQTFGLGRGSAESIQTLLGLGRGSLVSKIEEKSPKDVSPTAELSALNIQDNRRRDSEKKLSSIFIDGDHRGRDGQSLSLDVNYVALRFLENKGIYEYHVHLEPPVESRNIRFGIMGKCRTVVDVIGSVRNFDGSKLYLPKDLGNPVTTIRAEMPTDGSPVTVTIKFIKKCQAADLIHFYNVLFKKVMKVLKLHQITRNYYDPSNRIAVPQHKLEVWPGYVTAVQEYEGGVMLNCDVSFKVLRNVTAHDVLYQAFKDGNQSREAAVRAIVDTVVMTRYNNKTYRVDDIMWEMSPSSTFSTKDREISFVEYYKKAYDIDIKDLKQPLLLNREKKKLKDEEPKLLCLIPELCVMTGLTDDLRQDFKVMRDIAQFTRVLPEKRQLALKKFLASIKSNPDAKRCFDEWNLSLDANPLTIEGRYLGREKLVFQNREILAQENADWGREAVSNRVVFAPELLKWCIVFTQRDESKVQEFKKVIMSVCPNMGMQLHDPEMLRLQNDRIETYRSALCQVIKPDLQIVVVIFPFPRDDRYSAVKKLCCIERPVPSQCINSKTIGDSRKLRSVCQKIALQMNCKVGGELWFIKIPLSKLMVCGFDTYHDSAVKKRSVLAFVASTNERCTTWYSTTTFQSPGQEAGDALQQMMAGALRQYHNNTHFMPEKIIVFRDGVGDGQMPFVADHEVTQLKRSFSHFGPSYTPTLTVVVVQKRINTRMYSREREGLANPLPGTVLDHSVTRKNWFDFFLVSQHVRQGTVTPTHYVVVYDDCKLKPEYVQRIAFKMTHMYYNWPGTVRVPAPCQYAHKLAFLVGQSLHARPADDLNKLLFYL